MDGSEIRYAELIAKDRTMHVTKPYSLKTHHRNPANLQSHRILAIKHKAMKSVKVLVKTS